jgi:hypothetical protein
MELPLTEVSNGWMHKLKEFERQFLQMRMEIERVKLPARVEIMELWWNQRRIAEIS